MITDLLAYWAQSILLVWLTVGALTIAVICLAAIKKRTFITCFGLERFRWPNRLQAALVLLATVAFTTSGLVLLLRPNTFGSNQSTPTTTNIDAIYILDLSLSMSTESLISGGPRQDCVDLNGVVRIEKGLNRKDCFAITMLDKFLRDNPGTNIAVVIFGGAPIVIGPTKDHKALIDSVWFSWARSRNQKFANATGISQALVRAELLLKDSLGKTELIVASDFLGVNFEQTVLRMRELKKNYKIWAIFIGNDLHFKDIENALGQQFTFLVKHPAKIDEISITVSPNLEKYEYLPENQLSADSLSWSNLIGTGMFFAAMICLVLFLRTIRWMKEGGNYE